MGTTRALGVAGVVVAAALGLAAGPGAQPAAAVIVPQHGMADIRIGMSEGQVRRELGRPVGVRRINNELGPFRVLRYRGLTVTLRQRGTPYQVSSVSTGARRERTRGGVGVGTPERLLRQRIRVARCASEFGFRSCRIGQLLPGRRVTDFRMRNGRVNQVQIGVVVD